MSRNKEKYDSSNARRQQIFLSAEDIAAGKKTGNFYVARYLNLMVILFCMEYSVILSIWGIFGLKKFSWLWWD